MPKEYDQIVEKQLNSKLTQYTQTHTHTRNLLNKVIKIMHIADKGFGRYIVSVMVL